MLVLPRTAAAAGPVPVRSSVLAVGHVHPGQALHERAGLQQPGGRVLNGPHGRVQVCDDFDGSKDQGISRSASSAVAVRAISSHSAAGTL